MTGYLMGIISAAGIVGILSALTNPKSAAGGLIRMVGGLYLMFVVIQPLAKFDFDVLGDYARQEIAVSTVHSAAGQDQAREAMTRIIKRKCESYIMDKALRYGVTLTAEVTVTEDEIPLPASVILTGTAMEYQKTAVERMIEEELNIPKEKQTWT